MAALDEARARLNPHQRAIFDDLHERPTGSTPHRRILAGAGTGKTATIVTTLASLLETGVYRPEEVLLGTFTKKAAGEMEERLKKLVSATTFAALTGRGQPRIGTFHRILGAWLRNNAQNLPHRHRWEMGMNLEASLGEGQERQRIMRMRDEAVTRAFGTRARATSFFKSKASLYADILSPEADAWRFRDLRIPGMPAGVPEWIEENAPGLPIPTGGDYALGAGLLTAYALSPTTQVDKPFQAPDPNDEDVMLTFNSVREYADAIEAAFGLPLLYKVWSTYEQIKSRLGAWDFDDVLVEYYRYGGLKAGLVLVDEAQDQSWVQVMTAHKIAGTTGRVVLVGDVRQCIPEDEPVRTPTGPRALHTIEVGDHILASVGGELVPRRVLATSRTWKERILRFTTETGRTFRASPDHVGFAALGEPVGAYVYLMWRAGYGYRIGVTRATGSKGLRHLIVRTQQEGAERLWLLEVHPTVAEAIRREHLLAYRYQIPMDPFSPRPGTAFDTDTTTRDYFREFAANGGPLLHHYDLDFTRPAYIAKASNRDRVAVNVVLAGARGSEVSVESRLIPLDVAGAFGFQPSRRGCLRLRRQFPTASAALDYAEAVVAAMPDVAYIAETLSLAGADQRVFSTRCAGILPGMYIPEADAAGEVRLVRVIGREDVGGAWCRDLEVEGAANFVVGSAVVHNSIYGWRGGAPYLMRDADASRGYRTLVLPTNYRSGSAIVDIGNAICTVDGERATWAVGPDTDVGRREDPQRRREINVGSEDHPQLIPIYPSGLQTEGPRTEVPTGSVRVLAGGQTPLEEARTIGADVLRLLDGGTAHKDVAILVRTNALGGLIEIGCLLQKLPVLRVSRSGKPFFEDPTVLGVLTILRAAILDDGTDLPTVLNTPRRGVYTGKLRDAMGGNRHTATGILDLIESRSLVSRDYAHEIPALRERLDEIRASTWHEAPLLAVQTLQPAYAQTTGEGDEDAVLADSAVEDAATYDALVEIAQQFDSLDELDRFAARLSKEAKSVPERLLANMNPLERAAFDAERERRILICTVHASKGLEFGTVYVPCSAGTFPSARSTTPARLAEERRLFYVAATRAVDGLVFTYSEMTASGKPAGPSPFLQDTAGIPPANGIYLGGPPAEPVGTPVATIEAEEGGSPDPTPTPSVLPPQDDEWAETWQEYLTRFTDPPLSWTLLTSGSDFTREGILSFRLPTGATREGTRDPAGKWTLVHVAPDGSRLTMGTGLGDLELFAVLEEEVWPPADWRVALLDLLLAHPTRVTSFGGVDVPWSVAAEALLGWQRPPEPPRVIEAPVEDLVERETYDAGSSDPDADLDVSDPGARGLRRRSVTIDPGNLEILTRRGWTLGLILGPGTRTAFLELAKAPQIQEGAYLLQHHTSGSDYVIWHVWGNEISGPLRAGDLPSRDPLLPGMTRDVAAEANLLWYGSTGSFQLVPVSQDAGGIQTYHVLSSAGRFPSRNARPLRDALAALQEYGWIEHVGDGSWRWLDGAGTVG